MITEDYVSFEIAKLLKEKGFDWETCAFWDLTTATHTHKIGIEPAPKNWNFKWNPIAFPISAPTLQMAMKWLREVHKLDIDVSIEYKNSKKVYYYSVLKKTIIRDIDCLHSETNFDSYEEACEAAIKYCLENLV